MYPSPLRIHHYDAIPVEERGPGMHIDDLGVDEGLVPLLGILLGGVPEESGQYALSHLVEVHPARQHVQLVPVAVIASLWRHFC